MNTSQIKADIRQRVLARRDALDVDYRMDAATTIAGHIDAINSGPAMVVSGYFPIRSELDVRPLMAAVEKRGAQLCLPVVIDRETIVFRQYAIGAPLIDAGFGTMGPSEDAPIVQPDLLIMPLAAFDPLGNRIGYGAGHYDRAISKLHAQGLSPRLVGCAFDCQCVDEVPPENHDVRLNTVLTEKHVYKANP